MATIDVEPAVEFVDSINSIANSIPWWVAAVSAIPVMMVIFKALIPTLSPYTNMAEGEAMTVYGAIGGATGVASQWLVSQNFKRVDRKFHVLELVPSIVFSLIASAFMSWYFTPPQKGSFMTNALRKAGQLPDGE